MNLGSAFSRDCIRLQGSSQRTVPRNRPGSQYCRCLAHVKPIEVSFEMELLPADKFGLAGHLRVESGRLYLAQREAFWSDAERRARGGVLDPQTVLHVPQSAGVDSSGERVVEAAGEGDCEIAIHIGDAGGCDRERE